MVGRDVWGLNYTTVLDFIAIAALLGLYWLYRSRERFGAGGGYAKDPVCGMQVQVAHAPARATRDGGTNGLARVAPVFAWLPRYERRWLRADVTAGAAVAVLGSMAAAAIFGNGAEAAGQSFAIRGEIFTVVGVTESKIEDQAESVFVPFTTLQRVRGVQHLDTITIAAVEAGDASRIAGETETLLRIRHQNVRVHCSACGEFHEWRVADALLTKAA